MLICVSIIRKNATHVRTSPPHTRVGYALPAAGRTLVRWRRDIPTHAEVGMERRYSNLGVLVELRSVVERKAFLRIKFAQGFQILFELPHVEHSLFVIAALVGRLKQLRKKLVLNV